MAYTPTIISASDYADIRVALGLDADDTTTVSDTMIERRMFLPEAERQIGDIVTAEEIELTVGETGYDADVAEYVEQAVCFLTAHYLASRYLSRRQAPVRSQTVGGVSVTYDTSAIDWGTIASDCFSRACDAMGRADEEGGYTLYQKRAPFVIDVDTEPDDDETDDLLDLV